MGYVGAAWGSKSPVGMNDMLVPLARENENVFKKKKLSNILKIGINWFWYLRMDGLVVVQHYDIISKYCTQCK